MPRKAQHFQFRHVIQIYPEVSSRYLLSMS